MNLTSIIILNYNGGEHLLECVESVFKTKDIPLEIILVDNNSQDGSQMECKKKFPEIELIQNQTNEGLSARNLGIEKSRGEFIVFLDSDTIVDTNWLNILFDSYKKNGPGFYQPKLLYKTKKNVINSAGNMINIFGLGYSRGKDETDRGQYEEFEMVSYTSGACTFSSSEIIKKVGKIDEIFFAYHDDLDYGWRGWLLGIPSYYEPKSTVYHLGSPTLKWSGKKFFYLERNRWICILTLYSIKTQLKIFPFLIVLEIGIFFYLLSKGLGKSKISSFISLIKLWNKIRKRREKFSKIRRKDDNYVIEKFVSDYQIPTTIQNNESQNMQRKMINGLSNLAKKII
ncbi:glycosyltransferase family 2 protein [Candidatus Nitrosopumilus sp. SW]|uniref:glycosyltransferase family 2 protein n=1 Tax=Candidatus Nitrosopumilus sp. SW TaxID=2508726 RepID=UPI001152530A|nr:glycosyltransferase family 2 protein [Candidatus Nitrosopumilus sp. SW]QDI88794.1 glycosyltransferase family 2 protein [Candidatus Nitrosopumilus sp. SW]